MKKRMKVILTVALLVALAALLVGLLLADGATREGVRERGTLIWAWVEAHVLSDMLSTAALIGIASVELIPVLKSFVNSKNAFQRVAADVEKYTVAQLEREAHMEEREEAFYARMEALREDSEARIQACNEALERREAALHDVVEELRALARGYDQSLIASEERLAETLRQVCTCADKTEKMVFLGFSNSCEMVKTGVARRIAEVEAAGEE